MTDSTSTYVTKTTTTSGSTAGYFMNPNTWVVILAIVIIAYVIYQMYYLWTDKATFAENWVAWTLNIVVFLIAIIALITWAMGYLVCTNPAGGKSGASKLMFTKGSK